MGPTLALLAACAFALGTVLQQRGTLETDAPEGDAGLLVEIVRRPVWLAGGLLQALGWVLQAAALDRASLITVQAICTLSLVLALPLGVWLTDQHLDSRSLLGAAATVGGIVLFLTVGEPHGGTAHPGAGDWLVAIAIAVVVVMGLSGAARSSGGARRAALFAAAAGVGFGLQAGVTKVFVGELGQGAAHLLGSWSTYVLIASALAGFALQQSALKTGALAPAMAASNATTLAASTAVGLIVFDESLSKGDSRLWPAVVGLVVAIIGVTTLAATSTGPDLEAADR